MKTDGSAPPVAPTGPAAPADAASLAAPVSGLPDDGTANTTAASAGDAEGGGGAPAPAAEADPLAGHRYTDDRRKDIMSRRRAARSAPVTDPSLAALAVAGAPGLPVADAGELEAPGQPAAPVAVAPPSAPAAAAPSPSLAPSPAPAADTPFVRVRINGMALDVPREEVDDAGGVAAYQIAKATEISLRSVKALEHQLRQQLAAPAPVAPTPTAAAPVPGGKPAPGPGTAVDYKAVAHQLHEAMLEANVDDMASALARVGNFQAPAPAAPAPAPVAAAPAPAPAPGLPQINRTTAEIADANAIFDREFAHISGNELAMQHAREQILTRMRDRNFDQIPLDMLVRDIGAKTAALAGVAAPVPPTSVEAALALRRAVKVRLPATSAAGAVLPAQPAAPAPSREQKASTYIQRLRKRSGSNSALAERAAR